MIELDLSFVASILAIGAFCFGIWRFFLSHAEKYDESHARNRTEHELIIKTLELHTQTNAELVISSDKLSKSIRKLMKQMDSD